MPGAKWRGNSLTDLHCERVAYPQPMSQTHTSEGIPAVRSQNMMRTYQKSYHRAATFLVISILLSTALLKSFSVTGHDKILTVTDPVLKISYRHTMLLAAALECGLLVFIWRRPALTLRYSAVLWFCALAGWYRWAAVQMGAPKSCPCLGSLTGRLGIPDETTRLLSTLLLMTLALLSASGLCIHWLHLNSASAHKCQSTDSV